MDLYDLVYRFKTSFVAHVRKNHTRKRRRDFKAYLESISATINDVTVLEDEVFISSLNKMLTNEDDQKHKSWDDQSTGHIDTLNQSKVKGFSFFSYRAMIKTSNQ